MISKLEYFYHIGLAVASAKGYAYLYDHLNRIGRMTSYDITGNQWQNLQGPSVDASPLYASYNYDANGNITKLVRNNASLTLNRIDSFEYHYEKDVNNRLVSNKLYHVTEKAPATPSYDGDIEAMGTFTALGIQTNNNYVYDNIGNLVKDKSERIDEIVWNVYGKIQEIKRETTLPAHQKSDLVFEYDPTGNRIVKIEKPRDISGNILPSNQWIYDYYVRDASGNIMANYSAVGNQVIWTTSPLYGSSRLGVLTKNKEIIDASGMLVGFSLPDDYEYQRGEIQFELSNHLGNVLAVVSDRKMAARSAGPGNWQHFNVAYSSFSDYYPFGMLIKERSFSSNSYRFGFNGKEKDDEVKGEGNSIAFEARLFDSRLGRFLSTDPLEFKYSWQTTYAYYKNSPVSVLDFKGMGGKEPVTEGRKARRRSRKFRRKLNQMAAGTPNAVLSQANFDAVYNRYGQKRWFYLKQKVSKNTGDEKKVDNNGQREAYRIDEIYLRDNFAAVAAARGIVAPPPVLVGTDFQNIVVTANNPSITNIIIPRNTCDMWQVTITTLTPTPTPNPDNISVLGSTGGVQNGGDVVSTPIINKTLDQRTFSVNYTFDPANWAAGPRAAVTWAAPVLTVVTRTFIAQRLVPPQPSAIPYYNRNFGFKKMILRK